MFDIKIPQLFSTSIDYEGQRKSEKIFQVLVSIFAVFAFIWGFYVQKFSQTLLVLAVGVALTAILILPPWPLWNKHPIKWQKVQEVKSDQTTEPQPQQENKKKK